MKEENWHELDAKEVFSKLNSSPDVGLSEKAAEERLKQYGYNQLQEASKINPLKMFLEQFNSFLVYILLSAVVVLGFLQEWLDFFVILIVILFNAILGFIQQYRAEKAIAELKKLLVQKASVMRDGKVKEIDISLIVPGDIVIIGEGGRIPADARIFELNDFEVNEAILTGESSPVEKTIEPVSEMAGVADRKDMVFLGTTAAKGSCRAIVTGTGMLTEFGKIAKLLQEPKTELTPLQKKLDTMSKQLGITVLAMIVILFIVGVIDGISMFDMFLTAVSLAVAAIPEGLVAVITLCLAFAVKRMSKAKALIRKLPAAETLGRVTVICSDKTGTITREELVVSQLYCNNETINAGKDFANYLKDNEEANLLLKAACLSSSSRYYIEKDENGNEKESFAGDYTEKALIRFAYQNGFLKSDLAKSASRIKEFPFSSQRKRMSVIRKVEDKHIAYVKGSPEIILERCSKEIVKGDLKELTDERKKEIRKSFEAMASDALRVLAFAYKEVNSDNLSEEHSESDLVFIGLQGMYDAPREEVKEAVKKCMESGIAIKMLTGDSLLTAKAVAKQIGLQGSAIEGKNIKGMSDEELSRIIDKTSIFARIDPEDKVRVASLLRKMGHIVAMTGDGVNDAPALKKADIGVAMGVRGSDVTRDVADIILLDDNFASIVKAVGEGRRVYDNIKKFTYYMISTNFAEVLIVFIAMIIAARLGWETALPLLPIQILWINLVTDGVIAITLSLGKAEADVMKRKPENMSIITPSITWILLGIALFITIPTLIMFSYYHTDAAKAQTIAFTMLVFFEGFNAFNFASLKTSFFKQKMNIALVLAVILTFALQLVLIYATPLHAAFGTTFLSLNELLLIILITSSVFILGEAVKVSMPFARKSSKPV
ncbi:MAG: cation-translocating P-type ATPase [archaeon]